MRRIGVETGGNGGWGEVWEVRGPPLLLIFLNSASRT